MINLKELIAWTRHIHRRGNGAMERRLVYPLREWVLGMGLFLIAVCLGGGWAIQNFLYYRDIVDTLTVTTETLPTYKTTLVESALATYLPLETEYRQKVERVFSQEVLEESATTTATSTEEVDEELSPTAE